MSGGATLRRAGIAPSILTANLGRVADVMDGRWGLNQGARQKRLAPMLCLM